MVVKRFEEQALDDGLGNCAEGVRDENGRPVPDASIHRSGVRPASSEVSESNINGSDDMRETERPRSYRLTSGLRLPEDRLARRIAQAGADMGALDTDALEQLIAERSDAWIDGEDDSVAASSSNGVERTMPIRESTSLPPAPGSIPPTDIIANSVRFLSERAAKAAVNTPRLATPSVGMKKPSADLPTTPLLIDDRKRLDMICYRRNIALLEANSTILVKWWLSRLAWVRLWGQLTCTLQVFDDASIANDIKEVFGDDAPSVEERKDVVAGLRLSFSNPGELRERMKQKFSAEQLNSIVENSA